MMAPYDPSLFPAMRAAGVTDLLMEISWAEAEPAEGVFNDTYLRSVRAQTDGWRAAGFQVALNAGMMNAPQWLLDKPGGRFVDQYGDHYTAYPVPNLVFGDSLRGYAQQYLNEVFSVMGTGWANVRAGGGPSGELSYPYLFNASGGVENLYWAYDQNAAGEDPVPSWRPGSPSPNGEAGTFLNWYLDRLASFQNWQVSALRSAGFTGPVTMLYPSYGMRPGDFTQATGTNLSGSSSPEINGEVQRGYDFARQISAISDQSVVVYSTWGDNPAPVSYLSSLAHDKGLQFMSENGGGNTASQVDTAIRSAVKAGASMMYLVRQSQFFCNCSGYATLADMVTSYQAATQSSSPTTPASITAHSQPAAQSSSPTAQAAATSPSQVPSPTHVAAPGQTPSPTTTPPVAPTSPPTTISPPSPAAAATTSRTPDPSPAPSADGHPVAPTSDALPTSASAASKPSATFTSSPAPSPVVPSAAPVPSNQPSQAARFVPVLTVHGPVTPKGSKVWAGTVRLTGRRGMSPPQGSVAVLLCSANGTTLVKTLKAGSLGMGLRLRLRLPTAGTVWLSLRYSGDDIYRSRVMSRRKLR